MYSKTVNNILKKYVDLGLLMTYIHPLEIGCFICITMIKVQIHTRHLKPNKILSIMPVGRQVINAKVVGMEILLFHFQLLTKSVTFALITFLIQMLKKDIL